MANMIDPTQYVTIGHAAELAGVGRLWMRELAKAGRVRSVCMDGLWFVLRADAAAFERDAARGRPRTSTPRKRRT